uniref:Uncharacterized protein n=1 Tax=Arundo donax TaxID=35708 RepID=A0A0A9B523_ARUDO
MSGGIKFSGLVFVPFLILNGQWIR